MDPAPCKIRIGIGSQWIWTQFAELHGNFRGRLDTAQLWAAEVRCS